MFSGAGIAFAFEIWLMFTERGKALVADFGFLGFVVETMPDIVFGIVIDTGLDAAFYPETTTAFGTYYMGNWDGCDGNASRPYGAPDNRWIRFHWTGGLELSLLILDRYEWTKDTSALKKRLDVVFSVVSAFVHRFPIRSYFELKTQNNCLDYTVGVGARSCIVLPLLRLSLKIPGERNRFRGFSSFHDPLWLSDTS